MTLIAFKYYLLDRHNYLLDVISKYYVPYQTDGRIGLSAA